MASSEVGQVFCGAARKEMRSAEDVLRAKRKAYNREYMRRWRAEPGHTKREQRSRRRAYHSRKLRELPKGRGPYRNAQDELYCGFCRKRPSIALVSRLMPGGINGSRYVEIRIPYCGEC